MLALIFARYGVCAYCHKSPYFLVQWLVEFPTDLVICSVVNLRVMIRHIRRLSERSMPPLCYVAVSIFCASYFVYGICSFKKELKKRKIPLSDYEAQPEFTWKGETHEGLQVYDVEVGSGKEPQQGNTVVVRVNFIKSL